MGQLWEMYEAYLKRHDYTPSLRQVAGRVGMSPTALGNWRSGLSSMPTRRNLLAFSDLVGVSYSRVVDAALADARYLPEKEARAAEDDLSVAQETIRDAKRKRNARDSSSRVDHSTQTGT